MTIVGLIRSNMWQIIVLLVGGIVIFSTVRADVTTNAVEIEELKKFQAEYPSQDWFELKFDNIDEKIAGLEKKIDNNLGG